MVTVKQLAELAGVSPGTVSHFLNGREYKMREETREKIRRAIDDTNYSVNMGGRILANVGSRIIGFIMTYVHREEQSAVQDPFFSELIGALERETRLNGYFLMIYTSASVAESLRMASSWNVEGLIIQGSLSQDCDKYLKGTDTPIVFIDTYLLCDEPERYVNVGLDDMRGGRLMARYLYEKGHRKAAFLSDCSPVFGLDLVRAEGFAEEFNGLGAEFSVIRDVIPLSYRINERHDFLREFASMRMKDYSALFFASDFYAVDAMNVFYDMGVYTPGDIAVCGFDGNIYASQCRPRLTTIAQNVSDKSAQAMKLLLKMINKEEITENNIRLPVSLIEGGSA